MAWDTAEDCLSSIKADYDGARSDNNYVFSNNTKANAHWTLGEDHAAIFDIIQAIWDVFLCIQHLSQYTAGYNPHYAICYYLENYATVSWTHIIEAWIKNDFEARTWTIAVLDRMRQIVWNEPYNIIWAARPEDKQGEL